MKVPYFKLILFTLCSIVIAGCGNENTTSSANAAEVKTYETVTAQLQSVSKTLQLNGDLIAYEKASIISKVNGYIKKIAVDIGQQVSKGQALAVIDAPEMNYQIAEANSKTKIAL